MLGGKSSNPWSSYSSACHAYIINKEDATETGGQGVRANTPGAHVLLRFPPPGVAATVRMWFLRSPRHSSPTLACVPAQYTPSGLLCCMPDNQHACITHQSIVLDEHCVEAEIAVRDTAAVQFDHRCGAACSHYHGANKLTGEQPWQRGGTHDHAYQIGSDGTTVG